MCRRRNFQKDCILRMRGDLHRVQCLFVWVAVSCWGREALLNGLLPDGMTTKLGDGLGRYLCNCALVLDLQS